MKLNQTPIVMVAASQSGGGKTTLTLALLAAFMKRGLRVGAIKTGPDYIDPAFHSALTGRYPLNIDSWSMGEKLQDAIIQQASKDVDIVVVESAMGLFDGLIGGEGRRGAPSDIAARYQIPVLMILDMSGKGQSVGPIALGFSQWSKNVLVDGIVLNRVASPRHKELGLNALKQAHTNCLGIMMRQKDHTLPERHLGLVQAREYGDDFAQWFEELAEKTEKELDIDAILNYARPPKKHDQKLLSSDFTVPPPPAQRIAVAQDDAFSFLYGHLSLFWRKMGAELYPFSPLNDEVPDPSCGICWLPGGYPELHGAKLAQCHRFQNGLKKFAQTHPIYGECGGYMVLGEAIEDREGHWHNMTGLLGHKTSFARRKLHLGYRQARALRKTMIGDKNTYFRGHEFHYATYFYGQNQQPDDALFSCEDGYGNDLGEMGRCRGNVAGSFFHILTAKN